MFSALRLFCFILIVSLLNNAKVFGEAGILKKGDAKYFSNYVVVKFKALPQLNGGMPVVSSSLNSYLKSINFTKAASFIKDNQKTNTGLDRIYYLQFNSPLDPVYVSSKVKEYAEVEWAEPRFVYDIVFDPNDTYYQSQYALQKIKANLAWDITKGDTNVVIGIVDTGVDWLHPDLAANIWRNNGEIPGNGIDDDNNGYVDDVRGWDFGGLAGTPDNDPREDRPDHGTHVAGIASAVTNNGVGIASIGYNCRIMPVKTAQDNIRTPTGLPLISFGYEGIIYAANNHASVINCSWGGSGFSVLAQETIDYAISKGALVVCAAGNDGVNTSFYPASYRGVISVAASNSSDQKASFSNYGTDIDVTAPGVAIFSTWQPSQYINNNGTSMASPLAAGLAALIKSRFPNYTALQVGEQLRVTCDDIYSLNTSYNLLLGKGRLNAQNAVENTSAKSVRITDYSFSDEAPGGNGNGVLEPGETISVSFNAVNYLAPVSGMVISLINQNNYCTVVNGTFNAPDAGTLQSFNNASNRFTFTISNSAPSNTNINFLVRFIEGSTYNDFQWIKTVVNPDYATQSGNNVSLTITSFGALGFNNFGDNTEGNGFHYKLSDNLIFEGALITGRSATQISDAARGTTGTIQNRDFAKVNPFHFRDGYGDHHEGETVFNDNDAGSSKMGITVRLKSYSYVAPEYSNFILLRYTITNNTPNTIDNFYAGLFVDWDLIEGSGEGDKTLWDDISKSGYVYNINQTPPLYLGTALVSPGTYNFYGILNQGGDGGFNIYDGFSDAEKWQALSSGIGKASAGPGDISHVTSGGPYSIAAGQSIETAFILGGGETFEQFRSSVTGARTLFSNILTDVKDVHNSPLAFSLLQNYPNPFNPSTQISFSIPVKDRVSLKIFDMLGREVAVLMNEEKEAGAYTYNFNAGNLSSGVYIYKLQSGNYTSSRKLLLLK